MSASFRSVASSIARRALLAECRQRRSHAFDVSRPLAAADSVLGQLRSTRDGLYRAFSDAAQCHAALGDQIDVFAGRIGRAVEKIVQSDRIWPLHVPVRVFRLQLEIDRFQRSFSSWTRLFLANSARSLRVSYMGPSAQEVTRAITETTAAMCQPQWTDLAHELAAGEAAPPSHLARRDVPH